MHQAKTSPHPSRTNNIQHKRMNNNSLSQITPMIYRGGGGSKTGTVPGCCSCVGFNYLTFSSTGTQSPCRWQALINVTLGSMMISSHDTLYPPASLSHSVSHRAFNFFSTNVSITYLLVCSHVSSLAPCRSSFHSGSALH